MPNTLYASNWDQAYRPSYAKIPYTVVRHIQVHLYNIKLPNKRKLFIYERFNITTITMISTVEWFYFPVFSPNAFKQE